MPWIKCPKCKGTKKIPNPEPKGFPLVQCPKCIGEDGKSIGKIFIDAGSGR